MANFFSMTISTSMFNFKTKQFFLPTFSTCHLSYRAYYIFQAEILIWFRICKPKTRCTCTILRPALNITYWLPINQMYVFVFSYGEKQAIFYVACRQKFPKFACELPGLHCEKEKQTRQNGILRTCLWVKGESFGENLYLRSIGGSESKYNNWICW